MPTTPRGVWTPNDGDDFDLITDLAATGVSIDDAIGVVAGTVQYRAGLTSARPAVGAATKGFLWFSTDTNVLWRHSGTAWELYGFGPFKTVQVTNNGTGTVTSTTLVPPPTLPVTASVTTSVACRAKITFSFQAYASVAGGALIAALNATGATTITPVIGNADTFFMASPAADAVVNVAGSWIVNLNGGTTTFSLVARTTGTASTRTIRAVNILIEPVSE